MATAICRKTIIRPTPLPEYWDYQTLRLGYLYLLMLNTFLLLTKISESSVNVRVNKLTTSTINYRIPRNIRPLFFPLGGILDLSRTSRNTIQVIKVILIQWNTNKLRGILQFRTIFFFKILIFRSILICINQKLNNSNAMKYSVSFLALHIKNFVAEIESKKFHENFRLSQTNL